ncbi:hypothetical protein DI396_04005 [Litorivita pollutaquae]|uniref:Uncharacterized protein n=1 Tax=Litorivita pollutaquae TaxID=2200892 RepID=A0A2V4N2Q8_9RHOB|nr:hypothetical protein [Litorivita pollutaquae]PYC48182.1 hypothetical protein DI396_04005 [Litorivita pollutaquae]
MTNTNAELKSFIRAQLSANCDPVPPKTATSQQVHLEVWTTRGRRRAIGAELGQKDRVNLWVISMYAPTSPPITVEVAKKVWKGAGWQDKEPDPVRKGRDGANSNLKGYDEFRTKPITRLGIQSIDDARKIFEHLFA